MTTEKFYNRICEIAECLNSDDKNTYNKMINCGLNEVQRVLKYNPTLPAQLAELSLTLRNEIFKDEMKKAGKNNALSAAKRILKYAKKALPNWPASWYANTTEDGQVITSNAYGVVLQSPDMLAMEKMPEDTDIKKNPINLKQVMNGTVSNGVEEITLPKLAELKAIIKIVKPTTKKRALYSIDEGSNLGYNVNFLIDIMEILGDEVTCYKTIGKNRFSDLYFENENGSQGLLLPIKIIENKDDIILTSESIREMLTA